MIFFLEHDHGEEECILEAVEILKGGAAPQLSAAKLPVPLPRGGLPRERSTYLFKEIREFVAPAFQDELCPEPGDD